MAVKRATLLFLGVVAGLLAARSIDVPRFLGGIRGDEATYVSMALSIAHDGDLRYDRGDYDRFVGLYGQGPGGIFLKPLYRFGFGAKQAVSTREALTFGKAFAYPLAAAPFVLIGGLGGLLLFNWVLLGACLWCAVLFCRARSGWSGAIFAVAFFGASVTPVYTAYLTPEIFNVALVTIAYFLWAFKKVATLDERAVLARPWTTFVAALLIGVATYSKATNAVLIFPLAVDVLVSRRWLTMVATAAAFLMGSAGLFGVNALVTGEANYQGATNANDRRAYYGHFPFDHDGTQFESSGTAMVTNDADTARVLASDELREVPINAWYFLVGRHGGLLPFYFPGVVVLLTWVARRGDRALWQWATLTAVGGAIAAFLLFFPDSWNGGGGPPGNRYFLSLYPALLFLLPGAIGATVSLVTLAGGLAFSGAMVLHPYAAAAETWRNVERAPLRWLPVELTLINDLPVRLHGQRGPVMFVREPTVYFYYLDANTYYAEGDGLWIAGRASTDIIVRSDVPLKQFRIELSGPLENVVSGRFAGRPFKAAIGPDRVAVVVLSDPPSFRYHESYAYLLHLTTSTGFTPRSVDPRSTDTRNLGVFVRPGLIYDR